MFRPKYPGNLWFRIISVSASISPVYDWRNGRRRCKAVSHDWKFLYGKRTSVHTGGSLRDRSGVFVGEVTGGA